MFAAYEDELFFA